MEMIELIDNINIVGSIDKIKAECVSWGDYHTHFEVEILTKAPYEGGKYEYAIFDVFYIYDLDDLKDAEKEIGEYTEFYDDFVLVGRMPYLLDIKSLPDGSVEEVYYVPVSGWIPDHLLEKREFTGWIKYNDLALRIRRVVANKPYSKKMLLFISFDDKDEYMDGDRNFIFVFNENDKIFLEVGEEVV